MTRKYFGTDGIRGTANVDPMTAQIALKVGEAAGIQFLRGDHRHRVVIGKDTRLSGYMIEPALTAGFTSVGMDVVLVGPMPTPAVAMLTKSLRADIGVMISASHNPYQDNGIKIFGPDGFKLSDEIELKIEHRIDNNLGNGWAEPRDLGRAQRLDDAAGRYIEFAKNTFPGDCRLDGLRIVLDCANGAAYRVAPTVLFELGAEVIPIGVEPDGYNINKNCGSTDVEAMQAAVVMHGADIGIALDGDADRVVLCDENGDVLDGDQLMALIASFWMKEGKIKGAAVVATVMSNLGLERYLADLGLNMHRTKVGDRYVVETMRVLGCNLGGEQSGHIIMSDYATTGDGLVAALQALAVLAKSDRRASDVIRLFTPLPQRLTNVRCETGDPMSSEGVLAAIAAAESKLGSSGRVLVRKSGTEPVVRVMAEADDLGLIDTVIADIVGAMHEARL